MKQITSLWPKECILCTTQEECDAIMDMMHDAGLTWNDWDSYKEYRLSGYLPSHCYFPFEWECWSKTHYEKEWYTIYPASDFIEKERKPKQGEWVFVRDHDNEEREKRIFLCEVPKACNRKYLCVYDVYESDYLEWKDVSWEWRKQIKQLPKEVKSTYTLELTEEQYKKVQDLISK